MGDIQMAMSISASLENLLRGTFVEDFLHEITAASKGFVIEPVRRTIVFEKQG